MWLFRVAWELGRTVGEIEQLSVTEFSEWVEWLCLKYKAESGK